MSVTNLRLPVLRGKLSPRRSLAPTTWFQVGGPAELLVRPADAEDLAGFIGAVPSDVPIMPIGVASNLLVRDGGIPGLVVKLGRSFTDVAIEPDGVIAGAGTPDVTLALAARDAGMGGLEFLCGIPGTLGGAVKMNAGAYGREVSDVLDWVETVDRREGVRRRPAAELGLSYRHSDLPDDAIVTRVRLRAEPDDPAAIMARMVEIQRKREASQPVRARTGGSTFANPDPAESGGLKAWELIDRAGCRGLRMGNAQVSELHTNFLINLGGATAAELEALGEEVRRRVLETSGVSLRWEIRIVGIPTPPPRPRPTTRIEGGS